MLSRTADSLYWLGRYSERAGNVARGLQSSLRMASLGGALASPAVEWRALVIAAGGEEGFTAKHKAFTGEAAIHWLTLDTSNPSSIANCIESGRRNARAVRTALTSDMWEAINETWLEFRRLDAGTIQGDRLPGFLDWVKSRTLLFNGAAADTMLRGEAWRFTHLGTMLERADNTARLLDVRHAVFAPGAAEDAASHAQCQAVLRAVASLRAYQHVYRARLRAPLVAELLIMRPELPRSLIACYGRVDRVLRVIEADTGGRRGSANDTAARMHARLRDNGIETILEQGLHAFITETIAANIRLGIEIADTYLHG
ncbi:putative alpha-E superfamily protein [Humitalea rosea]|uniref:Putative alpha-E superfamily protein n=1 Tax=Humitalea rosea TaxID=990373 RepID=A0A2W7IT77_9PROT|nr:alpha-E domain-containing protein [Humitalea rosea]PZW50404.1 putative alpha-E superfamily protein [Humitalea rosea]